MRITDNQNEIFDMVDENDNVVGQVSREVANKSPNIIHRIISVAVFNSKGELYLQKRSKTKDTEPGKWTISCSGHVNSGDYYENTAKRELEEELGLILHKGIPRSTARDPLEPVAKYICRAPNETEMTMLYKTVSDGPFRLHPQEISKGKFFIKKELENAVKSGKIKLSFMGKVALQKLGWM